MANSKQKGSSFERLMCKKLSLWVTGGDSDSIFWRSAMSGGRATVKQNKLGSGVGAGDISAVEERGYPYIDKFVFECKSYKNIKLFSLFTGTPKEGSIYDFWTTTVKLGYQLNKKPVVLVRENNKPTLIGLFYSGAFLFDVEKIGAFPQYNLVLCVLDEFIKNVHPRAFLNNYK